MTGNVDGDFTDERVAIVLGRTRVRLRERTFASMAGRLLDLLATAPQQRQLVVRDNGPTIVVPHDDIVWMEAEDYCARIHPMWIGECVCVVCVHELTSV
jgi:hypothetical protein